MGTNNNTPVDIEMTEEQALKVTSTVISKLVNNGVQSMIVPNNNGGTIKVMMFVEERKE